MPAILHVRLIKLGYETRDGRKSELIVVTTLLDPKQHCGIELADLYARRWDIELKLLDLKTTLGMERFAVKSPQMTHKTLWMSMIAFNLIRSLMQRAAVQNNDPVWHFSFKGVIDHVVASHESFRAHAGRRRNLAHARTQLIAICATKKIDLRPFRIEPRAIKKRPKNYQLLTEPRAVFREISHRNAYKKCA